MAGMATNQVSGSSSSSSSTLATSPSSSPRNVSRTRDRPKPPLTPLGQSFTFGLKAPPGVELTTQPLPLQNDRQRKRTISSSSAVVGPRTRRGHHHKHSLSHNFFSFLDPGTTTVITTTTTTTSSCAQEARKDEEKALLHTQPTPVPVSQWDAGCAHSHLPYSAANGHLNAHAHDYFQYPQRTSATFRRPASLFQLVLGAALWVRSQQVGSIACTGIGYWVVFDAIGVFLGGYRENNRRKRPLGVDNQKKVLERIRQPYGAARLLTVLNFAQAIYLMFSAVYVCKETIEHLLLSAGGPGEDGHHHHTGDGDGVGIDFPVVITSLSLISIFIMAYSLNNNSRIFAVTNNRIPSISTSFRRVFSLASTAATSPHFYPVSFGPLPLPKSRLGYVLSNPFVACPLWFGGAVVCVGLCVNQIHHRIADLLIASLLSLATFRIAYQTCLVLGSVLLQTAPPRGAPGGKMEAFLRVMRELERHPHVVHLPAPRLWQLSPQLAFSPDPFPTWSPLGTIRFGFDHDLRGRYSSEKLSPLLLPPPPSTTVQKPSSPTLVATVQIHVPWDLPDEDVLALTNFAWERCMRALLGDGFVTNIGEQKKGEVEGEDKDEDEEVQEGIPEVTVGIVRG